jgi:hypothetical protein
MILRNQAGRSFSVKNLEQREVAENADAFITTSVETPGLTAPAQIPPPPTTPSLLGAIQLSPEDQVLAMAAY